MVLFGLLFLCLDAVGLRASGFRMPYAPFYVILALTAIIMVWRNSKLLRARNRRAAGLCPRCCYDLRGTKSTNACPECGWRPVLSS